MQKPKPIIFSLLSTIILFTCLYFQVFPLNGNQLFHPFERMELRLGTVVFNSIADVDPLEDGGYVLLLNRSYHGDNILLLTVDKSGKLTHLYDRQGNGPGQLRSVKNVVVANGSILAGEFSAPYIHKFNSQLEFQRDFRINRGGKLFDLGKYYGIWTNTQKEDAAYILSLYDKSFKFVGLGFQVSEFPLLVQFWGDICPMETNAFCGVYVNDHKVNIFSRDLKQIKSFPIANPDFTPYKTYKGDKFNIGSKAVEWMESWTKLEEIYYTGEYFIIKHSKENRNYFDVMSKEGKMVITNHSVEKDFMILHYDGTYFYRIQCNEIDDDNTKCFLVKEKFEFSDQTK